MKRQLFEKVDKPQEGDLIVTGEVAEIVSGNILEREEVEIDELLLRPFGSSLVKGDNMLEQQVNFHKAKHKLEKLYREPSYTHGSLFLAEIHEIIKLLNSVELGDRIVEELEEKDECEEAMKKEHPAVNFKKDMPAEMWFRYGWYACLEKKGLNKAALKHKEGK